VAFNNANPNTKNLFTKFSKGFETIKQNGEYIRILETYWGKNNIQKEVLPKDMAQYGTDKVNLELFSQYAREPWGRIK